MSFEMIAHYRQAAETVQELDLGWLKPLREVIPELAVWGRWLALDARSGHPKRFNSLSGVSATCSVDRASTLGG